MRARITTLEDTVSKQGKQCNLVCKVKDSTIIPDA